MAEIIVKSVQIKNLKINNLETMKRETLFLCELSHGSVVKVQF